MSLNVFPDLPGQQWKSKKRMKWDVSVQKSAQQVRKTMINQNYPSWEINVQYKGLTKYNADIIMGFFGQQKGAFLPFLWKDLEDYKVTAQPIGTGTGSSETYYLTRSLGNGIVLPVYDVVPNTLKVYVDGTQTTSYTLGVDGKITMTATSGKPITATFEYYWRVAFDADYNEQTVVWYDIYENASMKLVTVL